MKKILFIDRDGTLIVEPADQQIDRLDKLQLLPGVIPALLTLIQAGFTLVMISNQDGLGTASLPLEAFSGPHEWMMQLFSSQGIHFESVRICPHLPTAGCDCRKPKIGLLLDYITEQKIDRQRSYVIGDRLTDMELAKNLGIRGVRLGEKNTENWQHIVKAILHFPRATHVTRITQETSITVSLDLDHSGTAQIQTGIGFFDHMLEQLCKHGQFNLSLSVKGDLQIDEHHTVEDTALALGQALHQALGDKRGIGRYGFVLPMDESLAQVAIDLGGRPYFVFQGNFDREKVGELPTELVPHFFRSLAETLKAAVHIKIEGENNHHMIEAVFKCVGRALKQAIRQSGTELPSTKGVL